MTGEPNSWPTIVAATDGEIEEHDLSFVALLEAILKVDDHSPFLEGYADLPPVWIPQVPA